MQSTSRLILALLVLACCAGTAVADNGGQMVRVAEIEVAQGYLEEYVAILKEEAKASMDLEPGVISIFPMYEKALPTRIRILEIYANREAYEAHLKTPHFAKYKSSTSQMIKSLALVEMQPIDAETMAGIFAKAHAARK
jgi:quinol monooxygenase YgiN